MSDILYSTVNNGNRFLIKANQQEIIKKIAQLRFDKSSLAEENKATENDFFSDIVVLSSFVDETGNWAEIFSELPKKKNGSFHKNRVYSLHRAKSLTELWEDHYGYAAPEIRVKVTGDYEAELQLVWIVEKW